MKPRDPGKIKRWRKTITELCGQLDKLKEERDIAVKEYYNQMNVSVRVNYFIAYLTLQIEDQGAAKPKAPKR